MGSTLLRSLDDALDGVRKLAFDSAPVIYFIEAHPRYVSIVERALRKVDSGEIEGLSSVLTLTEVLTRPLQLDQRELQGQYLDFLLHSRNFSIVSLDAQMSVRAAELRAIYGIRTPDALQLACAIETGSQAFFTNDSKLKKIKEISVIILDDILQNDSESR